MAGVILLNWGGEADPQIVVLQGLCFVNGDTSTCYVATLLTGKPGDEPCYITWFSIMWDRHFTALHIRKITLRGVHVGICRARVNDVSGNATLPYLRVTQWRKNEPVPTC